VNELLTCHNVRLAHSSVCAIHDDADRIRDIAECSENVKCEELKKGLLCSRTTTVL